MPDYTNTTNVKYYQRTVYGAESKGKIPQVIAFAMDNYSKYGELYSFDKEIKIELITSRHGGIIKPRVEKSKTEQQQRVRQKAEVFTPSWVCNLQNNQIDAEWFGQQDVFNIEKEK